MIDKATGNPSRATPLDMQASVQLLSNAPLREEFDDAPAGSVRAVLRRTTRSIHERNDSNPRQNPVITR